MSRSPNMPGHAQRPRVSNDFVARYSTSNYVPPSEKHPKESRRGSVNAGAQIPFSVPIPMISSVFLIRPETTGGKKSCTRYTPNVVDRDISDHMLQHRYEYPILSIAVFLHYSRFYPRFHSRYYPRFHSRYYPHYLILLNTYNLHI